MAGYRYTRHPIRDEDRLVSSRTACLRGTHVVPAKFWTGHHADAFEGLVTLPRARSLELYGHPHIHGTLDGVPVIVQEWLGAGGLPFRKGAWLFHPNTPGNALVVLRGDVSVTVEQLRAHARRSPQWETQTPPFVPFPDLAELRAK